MRQQHILGYYVVNAAGQQVAWHKVRREAQKIALRLAASHGGIFYTQPEYEVV